MDSIVECHLHPGAGPRPRIFLAELSTIDGNDAERLVATLDEDERSRGHALDQDEMRRLFEIAHGLMRHAVATYLGITLEEVRILSRVNEKPRLVSPAVSLDISMTHTGRTAVCAVLRDGLVGIDAEMLRERTRQVTPMLAPEERDWLAANPCTTGGNLAIWTLKEAVAKALGLGLRLDFDSFAVQPDSLLMLRAPAAHPGPWSLWQTTIGRTILAAAWCPSP